MLKHIEKFIPYVIQIGIAIFLFFTFKENFVSLFKSKTEAPKQFSHNSGLDEIQVASKCEALYNAMITPWGTDEDTIFSILGAISVDDYKAIYNYFGLRAYSKFTGRQGIHPIDERLDLTSWLNHELNNEELTYLKTLNPYLF